MPDKRDKLALILVAHADDEALGCGGTIPRLLQAGWSVRVVIASCGVVEDGKARRDNRKPARRACAVLGVTTPPTFLGFPDQRFETTPLSNIADAVLRLELKPDLVITHVDTDLNSDHRIVCEVAKLVARPHKGPVSLLGCEIPGATSWNGQAFSANYYVNVTEFVERKVRAFECYRNEVHGFPHPWSRDGILLLAKYHGMQCGYPYAEAFRLTRGYSEGVP